MITCTLALKWTTKVSFIPDGILQILFRNNNNKSGHILFNVSENDGFCFLKRHNG